MQGRGQIPIKTNLFLIKNDCFQSIFDGLGMFLIQMSIKRSKIMLKMSIKRSKREKSINRLYHF